MNKRDELHNLKSDLEYFYDDIFGNVNESNLELSLKLKIVAGSDFSIRAISYDVSEVMVKGIFMKALEESFTVKFRDIENQINKLD